MHGQDVNTGVKKLEALDLLERECIGSCELPSVDVSQTQVLCKRSMHS